MTRVLIPVGLRFGFWSLVDILVEPLDVSSQQEVGGHVHYKDLPCIAPVDHAQEQGDKLNAARVCLAYLFLSFCFVVSALLRVSAKVPVMYFHTPAE